MKDKRIANIIKLFKQAYSQYKLQILILTALGFLSGILEGIGINALIPLFSFIFGQEGGGQDLISQLIEKFFIALNITFSVKYLLIFVTLLFLFKAAILVYFNYVRVKIISDYEEKARTNLLNKTLLANWSYLVKQKIGHLESSLMIDINHSSSLLTHISNAIMTVTGLIVYLLVAVNISPTITIITVIISAVLFLIFKPLLFRVKQNAQERTGLIKDTAHHVGEHIGGIKTIKTMVVSGGVLKIAKKYFVRLRQLTIRNAILKNLMTAFFQPIGVIFILVIFAVSYKTQSFNLVAIVALIYLIQRIFTYVQQLQKSLHTSVNLVPHLASVLEFERKADANKEIETGRKKFIFNKCLKFNDVNFAYNQDKEILTDINLKIDKGSLVGLIGPSGVGKTTLVDIILRLYNPTSGQVLLDDQDIKEISLNNWRRNIGYVSQDMFLINDTITNNIKFYSNNITDQDVKRVARQANIYDFIQTLPDKFNTVVGDRGILLSVGQRQRIIIARVLARQPQLLVLDEATSALDSESEAQIQKVIKNLKGNITVLAIAHRLQTVMDSDMLLVLDEGTIKESGSPQKLLKNKNSYFFKVYNIRK